MAQVNLPHILLPTKPESKKYTNPRSGRNNLLIEKRDKNSHGKYLLEKLSAAWKSSENQIAVYKKTRKGIYLEFKGLPDFKLPITSFESIRSKQADFNIRVLNVRDKDDTQLITVFVPFVKKDFFFDKINDYLEKTSKYGKPLNQKLINNLMDIQDALRVESFWQDPEDLIPKDTPEWCEIWLKNLKPEIRFEFTELLQNNNIPFKDGFIEFPERLVKIIKVSKQQLSEIIIQSDEIAEIRKAKDTDTFWVSYPNNELIAWIEGLLTRIDVNQNIDTSVCLLDTGVNFGHPLLSKVISENDCQSVNENWGTFDNGNHGTLMAGLAIYGNLSRCLTSSYPIKIAHLIESVKILPNDGQDKNDPELWGYITSQAISLAEIQKPNFHRINCLAVTSTDTLDNGRPSSWSGAIDQITSGALEEGKPKRLVILSAGNVYVSNEIIDYPNNQLQSSIHDPGQSWNAITIGAFTNLDTIRDGSYKGFEPLAPKGGISPFTTSSINWSNEWPIKPEVLFEGGNVAFSELEGFPDTDCPDLSLISTNSKPLENYFHTFNMTSAATGQAAWFASQIQSEYPGFWPETIRGLIVHSASWTDIQKNQFLKTDSKESYKNLLRICGYGVPSIEKAKHSASNNLTLIAQEELQPYEKVNSDVRTNEMHLYELPWPIDVLRDLPPQTDIKMRITLSYFIEPSPGNIGWQDRYRYPSHTLKFFVKSPIETLRDFEMRVNKTVRNPEDDYHNSINEGKFWLLGYQLRYKGSLHTDIWHGTPQELADSNIIAIVPGGGWWKERKHLQKYNEKARYSLIVSIFTPDESIDVYTPVYNLIRNQIEILT